MIVCPLILQRGMWPQQLRVPSILVLPALHTQLVCWHCIAHFDALGNRGRGTDRRASRNNALERRTHTGGATLIKYCGLARHMW